MSRLDRGVLASRFVIGIAQIRVMFYRGDKYTY